MRIMFEHNHENGNDNMNNAQNQGFNETPLDQEPVYNSYSAMRNDEPGSYQQSYYSQPQQSIPGDSKPPKKRRILPKVAAAVAGVMVVSFASIQCYRFIDGNETLSAFFASTNSGVSLTDSSKADSSSTADSSLADDGKNWMNLAASTGTLSTTEVVDKVMPSVVGVASTFSYQSSGFGGWFGAGQSQEQNVSGTGTGIIMSADGYIITNAHVIYESDYGGKASKVSVVLSSDSGYDQTEYEATIVGYDVEADLAVLKIDAKNLVPAEFGDSDKLKVGELAIAIGNPLGFELFGSVTCGIISALNREVTINENTMNLIQTDAAINSGNSGGPLINSSGQVIGINSAKLSSNYSNTTIEGLGFAIPITEAKTIINDLINFGYVTGKPQIGIGAADVSETQSRMYNIPVGVYVSEVYEGGAADQGGIKKGDVIIAVNGETIKTYEELNGIKNQFKAGDKITLTVTRGDQDLDIEIVLQEKKPTAD